MKEGQSPDGQAHMSSERFSHFSREKRVCIILASEKKARKSRVCPLAGISMQERNLLYLLVTSPGDRGVTGVRDVC